jgi:ribosomal protein S21
MAHNISVELRRGESSERLIRRFIKKCKRERIVETYRSKTDFYIKPSVKRKMKSEKAARERQKLERKKDKKNFR